MEYQLNCEWCGLPFFSNQPHTRFCCDKCAKLYSKQKYRQMGIDALEAKICAQTSDTLREGLRSKDVLSTSEAAKYLGVCRTTVSRYLALGMLPAVQLPGKNLFRKTELDKILNLETGVTRLKGEVSGIDTDTSNLNDRVQVLAGRKVIAFPDVDGYDTWIQKAAERPHLGIIVSDLLEKNATTEERATHIDIADLLIRWMQEQPLPCSPASDNPVFLEVKKYISPEYHAEVLVLIKELGLEWVGVTGSIYQIRIT